MMCLVSIIVPTYNRASLLRQCHASVVAQTHRPLELIIVDDASTDDTETVVANLPEFAGVFVRYLKLPQNGGVSKARNFGIREAKGEIIAFLDSDDVWFPQHLSTLIHSLVNQDADLAFSQAEIRTAPDAPSSGRIHGPNDHEKRHFEACLYFYNPVLPTATVARRAFFDKAGLFDETAEIQHAEDWDLMLRATGLGLKIHHVEQPTVVYTVPGKLVGKKYRMMMRCSVRCLEKHQDYPHTPLLHRILCLCYFKVQLGRVQLEDGQTKEAQKTFMEVFQKGWRSPSLAATGLAGCLLSWLGHHSSLLSSRILCKGQRWVRADYRKLRGYSDCWD